MVVKQILKSFHAMKIEIMDIERVPGFGFVSSGIGPGVVGSDVVVTGVAGPEQQQTIMQQRAQMQYSW